MVVTANEKILDRVIAHAIQIERYKNGLFSRLLAGLDDDFDELVAQTFKRLSRIHKRITGRAVGSSALTQSLNVLVREQREILREAYREAKKAASTELVSFAATEAEWIRGAIQSSTPITVDFALPTTDTLQTIVNRQPVHGKMLNEWFGDLATSAHERIASTTRKGVMEGRSVDDIVRSIVGTGAQGFRDGDMATVRRNLHGAVRTIVNDISAQTREQTYEDSEVVDGVRYVATLDSRTTEICFDGSTRVTALGQIRRVFRRQYDGEFLVVRTSSAEEIRVTPNHPILTARGWLAAKELRPRQDVLYAVSGDGLCIGCREHVGVPPSFAELADAAIDPTVSEIESKGSAAADFHGDGGGIDHQIDIATPEGHLPARLNAVSGEHILDELFGGEESGGAFSTNGGLALAGIGNLLRRTDVAAQLPPVAFENRVDSAVAVPGDSPDLFGLESRVEQVEDPMDILRRHDPGLPSLELRSDAQTTQSRGHRRRADTVIPCDRCGALAVTVSANDVVQVRSEFGSDHVYNLESESGTYLANGILSKNCAGLDGRVFKVREGPRPPQHFACRSTTAPVLKSWKQLGIDLEESPPGTRAQMPGSKGVATEKTTYGTWLKRQSVAIQNDVLGVERAKLFRRGEVDISRFVDYNKTPPRKFTLEELRKREGLKPPKKKKPKS